MADAAVHRVMPRLSLLSLSALCTLLGACHYQCPRPLQPRPRQASQGEPDAGTGVTDGLPAPTLDEALSESPLVTQVRDHNVYGCSQTTVDELFEGSFNLNLNQGGTGTARLEGHFRELERSFVDNLGPRERLGEPRYDWVVAARRVEDELRLELTARPGCEPDPERYGHTRGECPGGMPTPPLSLTCRANRLGELSLETIRSQNELADNTILLVCSAPDADPSLFLGELWFLTQPFPLAPPPGANVRHSRGDYNIEGELLRPEDSDT